MRIFVKRFNFLLINYAAFVFIVVVLFLKKYKNNFSIQKSADFLEDNKEWIEVSTGIFLKRKSVLYFQDAKKMVLLFTCKNGTLNERTKFTFNFSIKYEDRIIAKTQNEEEQANNELKMFFNIRHYQNFILIVHLDLGKLLDVDYFESKKVDIGVSARLQGSLFNLASKVKVSRLRSKTSRETNAVICTEPLFLEEKDYQNLAWWIELNKMSGYKKIVLFNNSIPDTEMFNKLFLKHKDFVEINQFRYLPNFLTPDKGKYLRHYRDFIVGEWHVDNVHFLGFDAIANNECLYANAHVAKFVLIQDNDEAFLTPRLEKLNTLAKSFDFLSRPENSYSANKEDFPTREHCIRTPSYFGTFIENEIFTKKGVDQNHSFFFQNTIYGNNLLTEIIFEQISAIDLNIIKFPIKLQIKQDYKPINQIYTNPKYGADFVLVINNSIELSYARNILDVHVNLIKPYLKKNEKYLLKISDEFKRFYFFKQPLVRPEYGKSLTNLDSSIFSDPHRPNGKIFELEENYMTHFRSIAILERKEVPISSFNIDLNYFYCYFQLIIETI